MNCQTIFKAIFNQRKLLDRIRLARSPLLQATWYRNVEIIPLRPISKVYRTVLFCFERVLSVERP